MKNMKKLYAAGCGCLVLLTIAASPGPSPAPEPPGEKPKQAEAAPGKEIPVNEVSEFMRAKLEHTQKLIEGLAVEDYDQIVEHSQKLSLLSLATNWQVLQTPTYAEYSSEFRRTADSMNEAGKNKNLDGAALAYVEMTMKCVSCHKYVRKSRTADARPAETQPRRR